MNRYPWRDTSGDIAGGAPPQWETPGGAQDKADTAETRAKEYSDTNLNAHIGTGGAAHALAIPNGLAGFISGADKRKLDTMEAGAQPNKTGFGVVNNIPASEPSDTLTINSGVGITISNNPLSKTVTVTATGTTTPGPHGSSHTEFGADPIPNATNTEGGLMSAADKVVVSEHTADIASLETEGKKYRLVNYNINSTLKRLYRGEATGILVTGDSLAFGSGASRGELDWSSLVETAVRDKFKQSFITWTNTAIGGTNSTYLRENWTTMVGVYSPSLIIISHGTNDTALTYEQRRTNFKFFVDQAAAMGSELLFVTNSTVRFTPSPYGNTPDADVALRETIAEQTREFAREFKVGLCDANQSWRRWLSDHSVTTDSTLLHYDHIHPNDLGHRIIAYEVLNAFTATTDNVRELDRRYGGKGYDLYGNLTFRDLAHVQSNRNGWGYFDMQNQLVDWGGMWSIKDYYNQPFKTARLWGTRAVTGSEPYENNGVDDMHIIPVDKDYIELEVRDVRRVWFALEGSSATATSFRVLVDGVDTMTFDVSNTTKQPREVLFTAATKYFTKGTHKVRIERVGSLPASQYALFRGFLVQYYAPGEPEIFESPGVDHQSVTPTVTYTTYDTVVDTRQKAANIGLVAPFGYAAFDGGFVQLAVNRPAVLIGEFHGDTLTLGLIGSTNDNYVMVYIDGILKATENVKDPSFAQLTYQYSGLGQTKHKFEVVSLGAQINLARVRFSDTLTG